ncbi:hypothetical protein IJ102_02195 [Candidatus Saccharibacteria bacterium]|nr:hypothetical protein [Candidatus Saccharibacteria bacterium]
MFERKKIETVAASMTAPSRKLRLSGATLARFYDHPGDETSFAMLRQLFRLVLESWWSSNQKGSRTPEHAVYCAKMAVEFATDYDGVRPSSHEYTCETRVLVLAVANCLRLGYAAKKPQDLALLFAAQVDVAMTVIRTNRDHPEKRRATSTDAIVETAIAVYDELHHGDPSLEHIEAVAFRRLGAVYEEVYEPEGLGEAIYRIVIDAI